MTDLPDRNPRARYARPLPPVHELVQTLSAGDDCQRAGAAELLGLAGYWHPLRDVMQDCCKRVRLAAAAGLAALGFASARAALLAELQEQSPAPEAIRAAARLGVEEALPALRALIGRGGLDRDAVEAAAVLAVKSALTDGIRSSLPAVRFTAERALSLILCETFHALGSALENDESPARYELARLLHMDDGKALVAELEQRAAADAPIETDGCDPYTVSSRALRIVRTLLHFDACG